MALPNGSGGYQVGAGNTSEAQLIVQGAPLAITATTATLTGAQMAVGLITSNTSADTVVTLPTVADLEAAIAAPRKSMLHVDFAVAVDDTAYQCNIGYQLLVR
jgi:hypothetical protein